MRNTLRSGDSYSLKELFTEKNRIVIPDMQREYCWAETISPINNKNLVSKFIGDLLEQNRNENKETQLGLLYAYESPKNDFQLCDGQQRITTLYLLLGYLYTLGTFKKLNRNIENFLVLDATENKNTYEIRLQYAIRESTLYFLNDLVNQYFLSGKTQDGILPSDLIKKSDWYFNEYTLDPSIQNILIALDTFYEEKEVFSDNFCNFILEKLSFLYFDMENRSYGEEQFVVLNTTGQPLTRTENLKPLFLGGVDNSVHLQNGKTNLRHYADLWEDWELFFWENRQSGEQTADSGLREFFRWIFIIEATNVGDALQSDKENYNIAQSALSQSPFDFFDLSQEKTSILDLINKYFEVLKKIQSDDDVKNRFLFLGELSQIALFEFLPLICYLKEFEVTTENISFKRLKQFFKSRAKDNNVGKSSITTTIRAIQIIKAMRNAGDEDIANYSNYESVASETILNKLEKLKFDILINANSNRENIEKSFWAAEDFKSTNGNIGFLFFAIEKVKNGYFIDSQSFEIDKFERMRKIVSLTFEEPSDLMRRTLLTFGHYYKWHGHTYNLNAERYSLGEKSIFFGELANNIDDEKQSILLDFLSEILTQNFEVNKEKITEWMENEVANYSNSETDIWEVTVNRLVSKKEYLSYMIRKLFCVIEDKTKSYAIQQQKVTSMDKVKLIKDLTKVY